MLCVTPLVTPFHRKIPQFNSVHLRPELHRYLFITVCPFFNPHTTLSVQQLAFCLFLPVPCVFVCVMMSYHLGDVFVCVESEWCDSGPAAESAMLSVSLSACRSVCCLFCVVFHSCLTAIRQVCCLREFVYMSSVSVFLQNQTSNSESQLGAYTYCIKMHAQFHRELHLQFYSSLPQGLSVYVCTYKRFHVYWCIFREYTQTHTHSCMSSCLWV